MTHKRDPEIATPVNPIKMTGRLPHLLWAEVSAANGRRFSRKTYSDNVAQ